MIHFARTQPDMDVATLMRRTAGGMARPALVIPAEVMG